MAKKIRKPGSGGKRLRCGRKKLPEAKKLKMRPIYLNDKEANESVKVFGGLTKAFREKVLPCLPSFSNQ